MGWTFAHREKGEATNAEWFAREFPSGEFLATATVGGTFYAAARTKAEPDKVFALVILTRWVPKDQYNFGYKDMDETMGPNEAKAPAKILDLLSPTDSEYAIKWRARCRKNLERKAAAAKVKKGVTVKFAAPIKFTNGDEIDEFVFLGRSSFRVVGGYQTYRIANWRDRSDWEVAAA